jgi:rhodanese-related sulfurtransferase
VKLHRILIGVFLALFMAGQTLTAFELQAEAGIFDFGAIREGVKAPVHFILVNKGNSILEIKEIRTFAACVQTRPLDDTELAPGESLRLDYVFESLGYGGLKIKKKIEVHYKGKKSPLVLTVKGRVLPLEDFQAPLGEMTYNYFVLLDLRSPEAFSKEHLLGAVNVPQGNLDAWIEHAEPGLSPELVIYLISEKGEVSDAAAERLREQGYVQFFSLVGGMAEWKRQFGNKWIINSQNAKRKTLKTVDVNGLLLFCHPEEQSDEGSPAASSC